MFGYSPLKPAILLLGAMLLLASCSTAPPQGNADKYPRKPADNQERKSGAAMLFYEAAEEDADPDKVIVIPPENEKTESPQ